MRYGLNRNVGCSDCFYGTKSKYRGVIVVFFLSFCFGNNTRECVPFTQRTGKSSNIHFFIRSMNAIFGDTVLHRDSDINDFVMLVKISGC